MEPILQVKNLSKHFSREGRAEVYAVDHISFEVRPGEILGIVGESGSGKSTIARLITGLTEPSSGSILLHGTDITGWKGRARIPVYEKIQMVFQSPAASFDPRRTLGDGICESLRNKGVSKEKREVRAKALLEECGLSEVFLKRYPHEVSGGECQRAAIARALMAEPELLLLDEATSALDVTIQKQIMELLGKLQKERQLSYLFICHNLALVQQFCDRILVLCDGRIVEEGDPDRIITHPSSEYAKQMIRAAF